MFIQFYEYSHPSKFFITYENPRLLFDFIDEIFLFFFFEFICAIHATQIYPFQTRVFNFTREISLYIYYTFVPIFVQFYPHHSYLPFRISF